MGVDPTFICGGGFQILFLFIPNLGEMIQFDDHIFSDGLKSQPPSRLNWNPKLHGGLDGVDDLIFIPWMIFFEVPAVDYS